MKGLSSETGPSSYGAMRTVAKVPEDVYATNTRSGPLSNVPTPNNNNNINKKVLKKKNVKFDGVLMPPKVGYPKEDHLRKMQLKGKSHAKSIELQDDAPQQLKSLDFLRFKVPQVEEQELQLISRPFDNIPPLQLRLASKDSPRPTWKLDLLKEILRDCPELP